MARARIGIIGGSGLYQIEGLTAVERVDVDTPFGAPSDSITIGRLGEAEVAFLPRHGTSHRVDPTAIPARANIFALKSLGVEWLLSISAVGSLREEIAPLHAIVPDQIFDRTLLRPRSFFGDGLVVHVSFADPFCPDLRAQLIASARTCGATVHPSGSYICIEGPQFSTRAESNIYRQWGLDIIGMTAIPEAKLAREAEICYATLAFATDYDVWHESEENVTVEMVVENLRQNAQTAKDIIRHLVPRIGGARSCACAHALADAIITPRDQVPDETRRRLKVLTGKYL